MRRTEEAHDAAWPAGCGLGSPIMRRVGCLAAVCGLIHAMSGLAGVGIAQPAVHPQTTSQSTNSAPFQWNEIGSRAAGQYAGDGVSVAATATGARIKCAFQWLEGEVTPEGLWLTSTAEGATGEKFRVMARMVGRTADFSVRQYSASPREQQSSALPSSGEVEVTDKLVRFVRPGVVEEYMVSVDGVRQDFVVLERPAGTGALRLELELTGARVEPAHFGARLVLEHCGRKIAYSRLHVVDATGRELPARIEVTAGARLPNRAAVLAVLVGDADAIYPIRIDPTFSDENWISMGGLPGADGPVHAAVVDDSGNLYIGGDFHVVGNQLAHRIAKWDGNEWTALGLGMNGQVGALAVMNGELYAGGSFTMAGGTAASRIAKWDGNDWSALGSGLNGEVRALAVMKGELYAGGWFTMAGEAAANYIAKWDGNDWSALGSGMNGEVRALAVMNEELYAGGAFTMAGEAAANYIAKWDGNDWSILGWGMNDLVLALEVLNEELYAGGWFTWADGTVANYIAKWDGYFWEDLGPGMNGSVLALAVMNGELYAGGLFTMAGGTAARQIAKWDGNDWSWSALDSGMDGAVSALAVMNGELYAGGSFTWAGGSVRWDGVSLTRHGGTRANRIAKWTANDWSALGSGINGEVWALAVMNGELYAGGSFTMAGGTAASRIAKWDGSSWSALGSGMNGEVRALAMMNGELYAGGSFTMAGGTAASRIAKWDGSSWSALGSGMNGSVLALAVMNEELYAGGSFQWVGGTRADGIAKWDGSDWSALNSGMDGFGVSALAVMNGELYAGGRFTTAGATAANRIAKWDGSSWSALGSGMNVSVLTLAVMDGELYAGGDFTTAGGNSALRIAKWDGNDWSALGSGMNGSVLALAVMDGELYAGGSFTMAGDITANRIAKWDGNDWSTSGSGMNREASTLTASAGTLFAGGSFTIAGDKVSAYVARIEVGFPLALGTCLPRPEEAPLTNNAAGPVNLADGGQFCWDGARVCFSVPGLVEVRWLGEDERVQSYWYRVAEIPEVTYEVGEVIPLPSHVNPSLVPPGGPGIVPVNASPGSGALWHAKDRTLYATGPGEWTVFWTGTDGNICPRVPVRVRVIWPTGSARYQTHVANTPPVDLSNSGFAWADLHGQEAGVGSNADQIRSELAFSATDAGRSVLVLASGSPADESTSDVYIQLIRTVAWNDPVHLHSNAPSVIGREITNSFGYHTAASERPFLINALSPYCTNFYDRVTRSGPIIPVNRDRASTIEDEMVIVYYQHGQKLHNLVTGTSGSSLIAWPWKPVRYNCQWPASPDGTIIVASQIGSGPVPLESGWWIYRQPDPARPGYNPNEEHAMKLPARGAEPPSPLRATVQALTVLEGATTRLEVQVAEPPSQSAVLSVAGARLGSTNLVAYWEGTSNSTELMLTNNNWAGPHFLVFRSYPDEDAEDGANEFSIRLTGDLADEQTVVAHEADTDKLGVVINPRDFTIREGTSEAFTLRLTQPPPSDVLVQVRPSASVDPDLSLIGPTQFTFSGSDWDEERTVTIQALADDDYFSSTNTFEVVASGGLNAIYTMTVIEEDSDKAPDAIFAFRDDLGDPHGAATARYSEPYVLAAGTNVIGQATVLVYRVMAEDAARNIRFRYSGTAGRQIQPFYPLSLLPNWYRESYGTRGPHFQDRKQVWWARAAGDDGGPAEIVMKFFYPVQTGFDFPKLSTAPAVNTLVPLLDQRPGGTPGVPTDVTFDVVWPDNVPVLRVGETLVKPKFGLPAIAGQTSVEIPYQQSVANGAGRSVELIDPEWIYSVPMPEFPGDLSGKIVTNLLNGHVFFAKLPPHLRGRLWWEPVNARLRFKGEWRDAFGSEEPRGYLLLNVITERDRTQFLLNEEMMSNESGFTNALNQLFALTAQARVVESDDLFESLALTAGLGSGEGYVTLAFNNAVRPPALAADRGTPVSMEIIKVTCPLYRGELKVIEPDDPFDERLTLRHTGDFAGKADDYIFEWKRSDSQVRPPVHDLSGDGQPDGWLDVPTLPNDGRGTLDVTIDGSGLAILKDYWYISRYRPTNPLNPCGTATWSEWTAPALGEGWIKRVMARIGPFEQKFDDYSAASVDTIVDMISQAGARSLGSIPLNREALNDYGLIEIYETVLKRGIELSIEGSPPQSDEGANTALMNAARRLADLYALLGNEAYADAADPTIAFGTDDGQYGNEASSIYCFMDQTATLLEEELALLRGISPRQEPGGPLLVDVTVHPAYNRLRWNFTRNITGGEVAYALNYNIRAHAGSRSIDALAAQRLFPQGHGDSWGHYLTALKNYYRLIRNSHFEWNPEIEFISLGGIGEAIPVNYMDERTFATIAASKARTGSEIVNLTYRHRFTEDEALQWQGYPDSDHERGWGVSDWASRAGQGAFFDWLVCNAMLPSTSTESGIRKVDRTTVTELREIAAAYLTIQEQVDKADGGLNPLGLSKNTIPFDIDPAQINSGKTHFEQIYDRAVAAMNNAIAVFNHANNSSQALRRQADTVADFQQTVAEREADFNSRLIEVFGYPYADDIGPAGSYPSGYNGPDLFHYMYVDPSAIIGETVPSVTPFTVTISDHVVQDDGSVGTSTRPVTFHLANNGLGLVKPPHWTLPRRAPGEIQRAHSDLLLAKARFERALREYENLLVQIEDQAELLEAQYRINTQEINILVTGQNRQEPLNTAIRRSRDRQLNFQTRARTATMVANATAEAFPKMFGVIAGMAGGVIGDWTGALRSAVLLAGNVTSEIATRNANRESLVELDHQQAKELASSQAQIRLTAVRQEINELQQLRQLEQLVRQEALSRLDLYTMQEAMQQAAGNYAATLARGQRILEDRLRFRQQTAERVQAYRYKDMAFRIFRNDALQKYRAQFDHAAAYVYLAAKAYDFETNLRPGDPGAPGREFLTQIVRARTIGRINSGLPEVGFDGDPGLADPMARMSANFAVLKGQLGFNNPQVTTRDFSLRSQLLRVAPGANSTAGWREALAGFQVQNIMDVPEVRRYLLFEATQPEEPGLVIPFSSTVNQDLNFFGWPAGPGDSTFNPSAFSTKIRSVTVSFSNYRISGTGGMSASPFVYLVPIGADIARTPRRFVGDAMNVTREWKIVDQWLPIPFPLSGANDPSLNVSGWIPVNSIQSGQQPLGNIRGHASFEAWHDSQLFPITDSQFKGTRLIGRSVWNDKWLLVIPGVSVFPSDRNEGLSRFIHGGSLLGGGRDGNGVTDIRLRIEAYSHTGR